MYCYYVFSDLAGFSKLSEPEIGVFQKEIIPDLNNKLSALKQKTIVFNTWGDAVFAVFSNCQDSIDWMLEYRDYFTSDKFKSFRIKRILPRIAAHAGEAEIIDDPLLGGKNAFGNKINMAARIEPVTRPGDIFVTKQYKQSADDNLPPDYVKFDEIGFVNLAKSFGEAELYRLRKNEESQHIIERISKSDLDDVLPSPAPLTIEEQETLDYFRKAPTPKEFIQSSKEIVFKEKTPAFNFESAKLFYSFGHYEKAIELIELCETYSMNVDNVSIKPFLYNVDIRKLKANCLSRLGEYEEAANIVYGLWTFGLRDSDTLSMLAAQYKRQALKYNNGKIDIENINSSLLVRSKELYLEAFRLNISDYYPAINAAYLYKMIGGIETGKGSKLASYIIDVWTPLAKENHDWWLQSTIAEAELVLDDYQQFIEKIEKAIKLCKPDIFQKTSTKEQIVIYSQKLKIEKEIEKAIQLLSE